VHLSQYRDETSEICHWHVPAAHYLESWGDARSYDGTVTIMQPLIEPLYDGKTPYEMLALFSDKYDRKPYEIVKTYWQQQRSGGGNQSSQQAQASASPATASPAPDFENWWRQSIHDGFIPDTAFQAKTISLNSGWAANQQPAQQS